MREGYNDGWNPYDWIETIQAEFICQLYDTKAGPTDIKFYINPMWEWNTYFYLGHYWQAAYRPPLYFYFGDFFIDYRLLILLF